MLRHISLARLNRIGRRPPAGMICLSALSIVLLQTPQPPPDVETLRSRIERIHDAPAATIRGVRLHRPDVVVQFFQARGFVPAWDLPADAASIRSAILAIEEDGLSPSRYHLAVLDALLQERESAPRPALDDDLQVLLTDAVAALLDHVRHGFVDPSTLDSKWNIDPREGAMPIAFLLEQVASSPDPAAAIETLKPSHVAYTGLKAALARLRALAAAGGWPEVPAGPLLKRGDADPRIPVLRRRLAITGELPAVASTTSMEFDDELEAAVRAFQESHRLTADGIVGPATLRELNTSAAARVDQVCVNLERIRWVRAGLPDSFVLVNIPAFQLYLVRDRQRVWETRVQVGMDVRQTPTFRADLRYLVFNPDWIVPPTILAQDIIPPMRRGQNVIASKGLTILDRDNRRVNPASIDWSKVTARNFPYVLRQPPGPNNALGRVKFVFPNKYAVFLHDTPSQSLFEHDERAFSSGCIRVEHALELASILLAPQGWTREDVQAAVDKGITQTVFLDTPLPVVIVYWTASVDASGRLRFARDIYGRDAAVVRALRR